jgi:hypothetical protein
VTKQLSMMSNEAGTTTALTVVLNVSNIVSGVYIPVFAKHSSSFSLVDCISVGVNRMQRKLEPTRRQSMVSPLEPGLRPTNRLRGSWPDWYPEVGQYSRMCPLPL